MRRFLLSLVLVFAAATAATGVHASTDCERWFIAYKNSLAQTKAAKQLRVAKHRVHAYVHRKLAAYKKPTGKPKVLPARAARRPKMSREEMLRRFNLACGELPENSPSTQTLQSEELLPDFLSSPHPDIPLEDGPGTGLIASNVLPPYTPGESGWPNPGGGGPPGFGGGFGGGGTTPSGPTPNVPNVPDPPIVTLVPEPSSVVFLLTGIAGAAGVVRRRFAR
jgi:hypothetical protein